MVSRELDKLTFFFFFAKSLTMWPNEKCSHVGGRGQERVLGFSYQQKQGMRSGGGG